MKKAMFNDEYGLTTAVLHHDKTMTRRLIPSHIMMKYGINKFTTPQSREADLIADAPWKLGEVLAVAQPYKDLYDWTKSAPAHLLDKAGFDNKMFVRAYLMHYGIRITAVRVERLQEITDEECLREGIECEPDRGTFRYGFYGKTYITRQGTMETRSSWFATPRDAFAKLIDKVSGRGTWERNPIVYVYEFESFRL